jgi:hypothetical protein
MYVYNVINNIIIHNFLVKALSRKWKHYFSICYVINEYFLQFLFIYGEDDVGVVRNDANDVENDIDVVENVIRNDVCVVENEDNVVENVVENWQETRDFKIKRRHQPQPEKLLRHNA